MDVLGAVREGSGTELGRPTLLDTLPSEAGRGPQAATPIQGCTVTCCDPSGEKDMKFPLRKYP